MTHDAVVLSCVLTGRILLSDTYLAGTASRVTPESLRCAITNTRDELIALLSAGFYKHNILFTRPTALVFCVA